MGSYSVTEAIELAVQTEKLGYDFYTETAKRFEKDKNLKNLFDTLALKEQQHEKTFSALKEKISSETLEGWEEASMYLRAIVESEFFLGKHKSLPSLEHIKSVRDAVQYAIGFEKETLLYFLSLADIVKEKEIINKIVNEEKSHILWLSDFRKTLK